MISLVEGFCAIGPSFGSISWKIAISCCFLKRAFSPARESPDCNGSIAIMRLLVWWFLPNPIDERKSGTGILVARMHVHDQTFTC